MRVASSVLVVAVLAIVTGCGALNPAGPDWGVCSQPESGEVGAGMQQLFGLQSLRNTGDVTIETVELLDAHGLQLLDAWVVPIADTADGGTLAIGSSAYPPVDLEPELVEAWAQRRPVGPMPLSALGPDADPEQYVVIAVRRDGSAEGSAQGVRMGYRGWWPIQRHHDTVAEFRLADEC